MPRLELLIVVTLGWHVVHPSHDLSKLQFYNNTLYVGGRNRLLSFDDDPNTLSTKQDVNTCPPLTFYITNYNKVLLLDESGQTLITCGTGNGGFCERRLLSNLSSVVHSSSSGENKDINTLVVSTDRNRPAVALMWDTQLFLMAVTYGENIPIADVNSSAFAYNALTLQETLFNSNEYIFPLGNSEVQLIINNNVSSLNDYVVYYKDAFQYQNYTYLLTNQKTHVGNDTFVSKVARLCNFDPSLKSYVDMELACQVDGVKYNLVQDATVAKLNGTDYLIASFAKSNDPEDVVGAGVVCAIAMLNINLNLTKAYLEFLNGYLFNRVERYLYLNSGGVFVSTV